MIAYVKVLLLVTYRRHGNVLIGLALAPLVVVLAISRVAGDGLPGPVPSLLGAAVPACAAVAMVAAEIVGEERRKNRLPLLRSGGLEGARAAGASLLFAALVGLLAGAASLVLATPYLLVSGSPLRGVAAAGGLVLYLCLLAGPPAVAAGHAFERSTALVAATFAWFVLVVFVVVRFAAPISRGRAGEPSTLEVPVLLEALLVVALLLGWNRLGKRSEA